jgi:hypothetical protein
MAGRKEKNYVSAKTMTGRTVTVEPYRPPASDTVYVERNSRPTDFGQVRAQWAQNLGGGLGAAAAWFFGSIAVHGVAYRVGPYLGLYLPDWPNWVRVGVASCVVGGLVFGGLMFLRSSLDELVEAGEWNALNADYDALEQELADTNAKWQNKYDALYHEYKRIQADYRLNLKAKGPLQKPLDVVAVESPPALLLPPVRDTRVLPVNEGAREDAIVLMTRAYNGHPWTRDAVIKGRDKLPDWGRGRWELARDYLVDAKVLSYGGEKGNVPQWTYEFLEDALASLDRRDDDKELFMSS